MINIHELEKKTKRIKELKEISSKTYIINYEDNQTVVLKEHQKYEKAYEYLRNQNVENVIYPIGVIALGVKSYYMFEYVDDVDYNQDKIVYDLREQLMILHDKTTFKRKLKKKTSSTYIDSI